MAGTPETRYARAPDGAFMAFQVFGSGPVDVLLMPGYFTNVDENWRMPEIAEVHRRIGTFARVIIMDRRGVGLSDRLALGNTEPLETHVDDVVCVLDATHAQSVFLVASESATALALLVAATHPERVRALALYTPLPVSPGRAFEGERKDNWRWEYLKDPNWGLRFAREDLEEWAPSVAGNPEIVERWGAYLRASASPSSALAMFDQWWATDVRGIYSTVHVPTLLMFRPDSDHKGWLLRLTQEAAANLPDARVVELPGRDMPYWWSESAAFVSELEEFITGSRATTALDAHRGLATVLFTDIVGSTERAAIVGDRAWAELLARHHEIVRDAIGRHHGSEIDTAGDGFLATFDGPARAVRAALDASAKIAGDLGIKIRAGVHTGEVEFDDSKPKGLAVHIGARVAACAGPSEVWASSTVRDLTAGSGLMFEDAGEHELKGVPDRWHLYRVVT